MLHQANSQPDVMQRLRLLEREVFGGNAYAVSDFDRIAGALMDRFALTRSQSMLLRRLLLSETPVSISDLDEVVEANSGHARQSSEKQAAQRVHYHISKIRGVIGLHGVLIEQVREVGYRLNEFNRKRLMKAAGITRI